MVYPEVLGNCAIWQNKISSRLLEIPKEGVGVESVWCVHFSKVKLFIQVGQPSQYYVTFWEALLGVSSRLHKCLSCLIQKQCEID